MGTMTKPLDSRNFRGAAERAAGPNAAALDPADAAVGAVTRLITGFADRVKTLIDRACDAASGRYDM